MKLTVFLQFETLGNYFTKCTKIWVLLCSRQNLPLWTLKVYENLWRCKNTTSAFYKIPWKISFSLAGIFLYFHIIHHDRNSYKYFFGNSIIHIFHSKDNGRGEIKGLVEIIWRFARRHWTNEVYKSRTKRNSVHSDWW